MSSSVAAFGLTMATASARHRVSGGAHSAGETSASTQTSASGGAHPAGETFTLAFADTRIVAPTFRKHLIRNESSAAQADYWRNQSRNKTSQLRRNFGDGESSDDCMSLDSGDRFKEKDIKDPETGRPVIPRSCYPALWLWTKSRSVLSHA